MKRERTKGLGLAGVFLMLATALPLAAQLNLGRVEGRVTGPDGKPLVGAIVEFERTDVKLAPTQVKTDKKGNYIHSTLPAGIGTRYTVRVIYQGEKVSELNNFNVAIGDNPPLNFDLKVEMEARKEEAKGPSQEEVQEFEKRKAGFERGVEYNRAGKYEEALAELLPMAEKDPSQWVVHAQLGVAYQGLNRLPEAEASLKKAIELQPNNATLYAMLGQVYVKQGKKDEARQAFETAAQLSPEDAAAAYYNIGVTFYNANDLKSAIEPFRKATELDPNRADAYYLLGMCLYSQAQYKQEGQELKTIPVPGTQEAFQRYLELAPTGKYAEEAKAALQALGASVPASVRVRKK